MASEGGGKIKNKRGYTSAKPYQRRKSLISRITDSIKDVLRPSWLAAADSSQTQSIPERDAATADEEEDEFLSPAQSPSQLPGSAGVGFRTAEPPHLSLQHRDPPHASSDPTIPWQQRSQGSSAWDGHSHPGRSTWGNSANTFDKTQMMRNFFAQKGVGNKPADSDLEMPSRGLGGEPSSRPSTSTASFSSSRRPQISDLESASNQQEQDRRRDSMSSGRESLSESSRGGQEEHPAKRQRLWNPETSRTEKSPQSAAHKPAFKISVFSSPSLKESLHESSFYSGKTMYGGASAYRRLSLNSSLPYQNSLPVRKSVTAKPLNNSGNAVLSSSATQILKTLERLSDAKRSRINETETESLLSFTPTSYRKPSRPLQTSLPSRSLELPVRGPPTSRLQCPVAASIAKNRQVISLPARNRPPSATVTQSIQEERHNESPENVQVIDLEEERGHMNLWQEKSRVSDVQQERSVSESSRLPEVSSRSSGKMKHQKSYDTRHGKPSGDDDEVVEIPNLRTDFTLPVSSMPALNFGFSAPAAKLPVTTSSVSFKPLAGSAPSTSSTSRSSLTQMSNQSPPKLQFTFSSPIQKSRPSSTEATSSPAADFQFSSPLKVSQSMSAESEQLPKPSGFSFSATSTVHNTPVAWGSTAPKPKSIVAGNVKSSITSGFGSSSTSSSINFGGSGASSSPASSPASEGLFKPAPQLKSGSVMDILGKSSQASVSPSSVKPADQLKQGSVMDILGGKKGSGFEAASGSSPLKPAAELKTGSVMDILGGKTPGSGADNLFAKFAPAEGSWECEACMIQNKPEAVKCVACETRKPGGKPKASAPASSKQAVISGDSLFAKFAAPAGSWECEACMLQNKAEDTKCVACETRKPGATSAPSKSSASSSDSLFAKFANPAGTWECEACMLANKPEATKCVACETPKRGAAKVSSPASSSSLMAKFRKPEGSWDCDVCLVQNTGAQTKCVACESLRPGTQSTGTAPPPTPSMKAVVGKDGGMVINLPSSSSAPSPFLAASATTTQSSTGISFGTPSSSTATFGGFQVGTSSSGAKDSTVAKGFAFGQQDTSNSNSASSILATSGFQFGTKNSSSVVATSATSGFTATPVADTKASSLSAGSGFQFGISASSSGPSASSGFVFGGTTASTGQTTTTTTTSLSTSVTTTGFSFPSTSVGGFQFGSVVASQSKDTKTKNGADKVTSSSDVSAEKKGAQTGHSFTPVFGAGKPVNNAALGAGPSLATGDANPLTSGGFQFAAPANKNSAPTVFGTGLKSSSPAAAVDSGKPENSIASSQVPLISGGFSFTAATAKSNSDATLKPGLFASSSDSKNLNSSSTPASSASQGFVFGAASSTSSTASVFGSAPQVSFGSGSKLPVNGEVGSTNLFAFGQQSATGTSAAAGFSFGGAGTKDMNNAQKPLPQVKQAFSFGADSSKSLGGKRRLDNDIGPGDAKRQADSTGLPSAGGSEPFKFNNPTPSAGNSLFKFGQTTGDNSTFESHASGFGSNTQGGGFNFGVQTNATNSSGVPQAASVFGVGAGTGQFSMGMGGGSQNSAAAASPFGSEAPAPQQGFNFSGATQPVFNFGANTSTPVFQFAAQQPADPSSAQPAGSGVFAFGQPAPSADSSAPTSAFAAVPGSGFGAAPAQSSFNMGTGDGQRKIKKAVRRAVRK